MMKYDLGVGAAENWLVAETAFDPAYQGKCEAIFCQGNGYLGQRAALEESYVGQTRDLLVTGTFNKFDDNEVTELPNLPDVTNLSLWMDGRRFSMDAGRCEDYRRMLDLRTGEVTRSLIWHSPEGKRFRLLFTRFVSMDNEHLIGLRACVTPLDADASIKVESAIDGRVTCTGSQHFHEGSKRIFDGRILRMTSTTIESAVTCCLHTAHTFAVDGAEPAERLLPIIDRRYMAVRGTFAVEAGRTLTIEKLTCVTTTRDRAYADMEDASAMVEAAQTDGRRMLEDALMQGYDALSAASAERWANLWEKADIRVESSRPYDQLAIRFALYHLNIMVKKDDDRVGIGAKGLTGEGYKGHSFWDTEIFILPYFTLTQPETARTLLEYRYKGLHGAHLKAAENGFEGAMYPWEAAWIDDGEVTPLWGAADVVTGKPIKIMSGLIEQHITADIAFAVWQYYTVTGDRDFMERCGCEMLIDTARFWASRVTWDEKRGAYVILDVLGPDEYKEHVDNNAFTNYMAAFNMDLALQVMDTLEAEGGAVYERLNGQFRFDESREKIARAREGLYLPKPDENGILPQFDGYFDLQYIDLAPYKRSETVGTIYNDYNNEQIRTFQVHKQADTLVLLLLQEALFPQELKTKNYYFYEVRTLHDSSLSKSTHCVLACDLREDETAYRFFGGSCDIDLGPVMTTSDMGVHTASLGGIWQCAVYGFGGVRVVGDALRIEPRLPENWNSLTFPLCWRGQPLKVSIDRERIIVNNEGTEDVVVTVCGKAAAIGAGACLSTTL